LSLSHTISGASASAATRSFTVLRAFVPTENALRADLFAAAFGFFADFELFAALRFVAMVSISSRKAR
jgi:hypothetical protein